MWTGAHLFRTLTLDREMPSGWEKVRMNDEAKRLSFSMFLLGPLRKNIISMVHSRKARFRGLGSESQLPQENNFL